MRILFAILFALSTITAHARLGETKKELIKRFGPIKRDTTAGKDGRVQWQTKFYKISILLKNDKSITEEYGSIDQQLTAAQAKTILSSSGNWLKGRTIEIGKKGYLRDVTHYTFTGPDNARAVYTIYGAVQTNGRILPRAYLTIYTPAAFQAWEATLKQDEPNF